MLLTILLLLGAALIGAGLYMLHPAACFIFAGMVLVLLAYLLYQSESKQAQSGTVSQNQA